MRSNLRSEVLSEDWNPAHCWKKPFSAPVDLMVSVMEIPAMVEEASLLSSRKVTRVRLTRLALTYLAKSKLNNAVPTPTKVSITFFWSMKKR